MPPLSLLIKPASSLCNLRCSYCFYHSLAADRTTSDYGMMSYDTLTAIIQKAFEYAEDVCYFTFQGGEPTLAGLDFFKEFLKLQTRFNKKNIPVFNAIQTNGFRLDESWASFLATNRFLVGLSLDGPATIHNRYRVAPSQQGTFDEVLTTVALFNRYQVDYNILWVVYQATTRNTKAIYEFFKKNNFNFIQFIPCLDPLHQIPGQQEYSLRPAHYARFLKDLFDCWYQDIKHGKIISVRMFDNWLQMWLGFPPESCGMSGKCAGYFVIESNGNVYPCDFYSTDEWLIGNIQHQNFLELRDSTKARQFLNSSVPVEPQCSACTWYKLCRGGCRRNRELLVADQAGSNYYCTAYQEFFEYSWERFHELSQIVARKLALKQQQL